MKILIFSWRDITHPLAGGAEIVTHEHAKCWVDSRNSVTVFSSHFKGAPKYEEIDGVRFVRRGYELLGVQIAAVFWYLFAKHDKFDLVIDQFHGIPFFTPLYVSTSKLAMIQEVAKEVWLLNHLPFPFNVVLGRLGYIIEPFIFHLYKYMPFLTGSNSAKEDLIKFGIPKFSVQVINHGIKVPENIAVLPKEKEKTIVYLGPLTRDKGIEHAIEAFGKLAKLNKNYKYWIVGRGGGEYSDYLKRLVDSYKIARQTKFWGFVTDKLKFELLSRSHVLIHPSIREGWGLNVIEAAFFGVPTVGYDVPGLRDSVKEGINGYLVKYGETGLLTEKIDKILSDKKIYESLIESSKKYAKKFSWDKYCKESLVLITKLVNTKKILVLNWKGIKHPDAGGAERSTFEHVKRWVHAGFEVTWFSSSFAGASHFDEIEGIKSIRQGNQFLGVQIYAPFIYWLSRPYNLVVDQFHGIPFFTPLYIKKKTLAFIHEVAKEVWWLNPWPKPFNLIPGILGSLFESWIFKIIYKNIPFMTVSESTKKDLIEWGIPGKNIEVIVNGISVVKLKYVREKEKVPTLLYLGVLTKDKGIDDAIDVFSLIKDRVSNVKLWIVGKGTDDSVRLIEQKVKSLNLNRDVQLFGYVSESDKFDLLSRAHILLNPSVREGWGLVNTEANYVGTPVVGYDVAGVRDSVLNHKTGFLSKKYDRQGLANDSINLLKNKTLYEKISKNCIAWSRKFNWDISGSKSLALIETLI